MVFNPSCLCHATGRDDDAGFVTIVEELALVDAFDVFETFEGKGIAVRIEYFLNRVIEVLGIALDNFCSGYAKGAVYIIVQVGEATFFLQLIEGEEYLLGAAYTKGGDDELAIFLNTGFVDPLQQHIRGGIRRVVQAVAIVRFYQYIVCLGEDLGRTQNDISITAYISAECEVGFFSVLFYFKVYSSTADNVTGVRIHNLYVFVDGKPGTIFDGHKEVHGAVGVFFGIKRLQIGQALCGAPFVGVFYFILLDAGGVFQKNVGQLFCSRGTEYLSTETVFHQLWDQAAVIDMGVGKDQEADFCRRKTPIAIEDIRLGAHALEQTTIQ